MLKIEVVLFDFDGVIAETMPYHVQAWQQVFSKYNVEIRADDIYYQEGQTADRIGRILAEAKGLSLSIAEIAEVVRQKRKAYLKITRASVYSEIKTLVGQLKGMNFRLGIVTGSIIPNIVRVTGEKFLENFDIIITGDAVENNKPHPEPYLTAAKKLAVTPEQCVVIENAPLGIQAAKEAGMKCIAVKTTIKDDKYLEKADLIVDRIGHISLDTIKLLESFNR